MPAWDDFCSELENTGVISDRFKAKLMALANLAIQDAVEAGRDMEANGESLYTLTFNYHGVVRVISNPTIDNNRRLLGGVELTRNGEPTNQYKNYRLDEIGGYGSRFVEIPYGIN